MRFKDLERWDTRHNQSFAINLCYTKHTDYNTSFTCHTDSTSTCHTLPPHCHTDFPTCHSSAIAEESKNKESLTIPCHTKLCEVSTNTKSNEIHNKKSSNTKSTTYQALAKESQESQKRYFATAQYDNNDLKALLDSIPTPPPQGWEVKTLGEICEINPKIDFKELTKLDKEVSFLPMEAVKTDGKTFEKLQRKAKEAQSFTKFTDNDLLWAKITPCMQNKKSLVVNGLKNGFGFGSTEFFVLRSKDSKQINIHFILQFLRLDLILQNASETFKGSAGQQRVPKEFLQNLKITLPPLAVQEKIVTHIQKIESSIATTQEKTKALELELERYIESTL
ncbi:restriction endonuclease subunit S [Helicobacter labetoulli]|uniref:restriction endonuclease subunit S n=1 Tax=Helicobacter labetoulli TaxID=2315333 RepID=UPI00130078E2|nr:restriction endonuclease subunit S [Helicobacter labetoulli]